MISARTEVDGERFGTAPELTPVAVTRWGARLVDPQTEWDYLLHRFADDRRRVLFLTALVGVASTVNFIVVYATSAPYFTATLIPGLVGIAMPIFGFCLALRLRSPTMLQLMMLALVVVGTVTRLSMLTLQPATVDMWMTLMVGLIFVIYLYLPIRLAGSVGLAAGFSCIAPFWWSQVMGDALPADVFYRGLVWVALANALGFTAANSLQRSQRMQYAQGLVMRHLLSTDAMTGIANRRRFDSALEREWQRCRRAGAPLSLLMIDVDHFKSYNDYCGHPQGDACLRQLARLLVDTVARPGDIVARYGGEEFVVLMPEINTAGALAVANKLALALRHADIAHPRSPAGPRLTISIGAATAKNLSGNPADLVEFADRLLYAAKAAGRNQISVGQLTPTGGIRAA
ncbi:MAG: diguanylate cyclase [Pseudolabrys sp.]|nr:diguanylate cyclase [Pseudolabrys sp.]